MPRADRAALLRPPPEARRGGGGGRSALTLGLPGLPGRAGGSWVCVTAVHLVSQRGDLSLQPLGLDSDDLRLI